MKSQGWQVSATWRRPETLTELQRHEVKPIAWGDRQALSEAVLGASAILVTPAPGPTGCPAHTALAPILAHTGARPDWIGYLSTTGVYGDRAGGWVYETSRLAAQSMEAARRVGAEHRRLVGAPFGASPGVTVSFRVMPPNLCELSDMG